MICGCGPTGSLCTCNAIIMNQVQVPEERKTERTKRKKVPEMARSSFDPVNDDLLLNILSRVPASTCASAACVSRSWNSVCNLILSRPKLASALSLNPSSSDAVKEVLDKVLSEPIRPQFALASVGPEFDLGTVHQTISSRLGSTTPVVSCTASGIIGRDALSNQFREVKWELNDEDLDDASEARGIVLTVGHLPGIEAGVIPLFRSENQAAAAALDKFLIDVGDFSGSVSDSRSPDAIIIFGGQSADMKPILTTLDGALPTETIVAGDPSCNFLYQTGNHRGDFIQGYFPDAVALVFSKSKYRSQGLGQTHFYFGLSTGLLPVGPLYKAVSVRVNNFSTWVTAIRQESDVILDGQGILDDINNELRNRIDCPTLYVGAMERRKCRIGKKKVRVLSSLAFHEILGGDEQYLYIDGIGMQTGDFFQFYHSDSGTALSSTSNVSVSLREYADGMTADDGRTKTVFGGLVFSCCGRGEPFFGSPNVDSSPITNNFPNIPVGGQFSCGEIGRCSSSCILGDHDEWSFARCCLHVYSSIYLVMSYTPL